MYYFSYIVINVLFYCNVSDQSCADKYNVTSNSSMYILNQMLAAKGPITNLVIPSSPRQTISYSIIPTH